MPSEDRLPKQWVVVVGMEVGKERLWWSKVGEVCKVDNNGRPQAVLDQG